MRGFRSGWLGALGALLLGGCATYSDTYYYDDGYAGGDYYYEREARDVGYGSGSGFGYTSGYDLDYWSPAYSRYYTSILYPPYWRSYDPWYTPGWYYGTAYAPGAGWRLGWSSHYSNPWWRSSWYSPFRHSSYYAWGGYSGYGYGYGHNRWYDWYRRDSSSYWRDRERTLGRRGYEPSRRWGDDNRASDEAQRIANRSQAASYAPSGYAAGRSSGFDDRGRSGAPSAYDRRGQDSSRYGQPSRFGNPQAADRVPQASQSFQRGRSGPADTGRVYGTRESGWIAPADGSVSRRNRQPAYPDDAPERAAYDDAYRGGEPSMRGRFQRGARESQPGELSRSAGYRRIDAPRQEYSRPTRGLDGGESRMRQQAPRYEAPQRAQVPRYEQPLRREAPPMESFDRSSSPRYEAAQRSAPRQETPMRSEASRFQAPERSESPRREQPDRAHRGGSSSREIERLSRDQDRP